MCRETISGKLRMSGRLFWKSIANLRQQRREALWVESREVGVSERDRTQYNLQARHENAGAGGHQEDPAGADPGPG